MLEKLPPRSMDLLNRLRRNGWETDSTYEAGAFEELNRISAQFLACSLVVKEKGRLIVEDDFRDELDYLAETRPEAFTAAPKEYEAGAAPVSEDGRFSAESLSPELKGFIAILTPEQRDVLYVILTLDEPETEIDSIAENALTMPELLIDGVNDAAMERLGDILVDSFDGRYEVSEQYGGALRQSIKQEDMK